MTRNTARNGVGAEDDAADQHEAKDDRNNLVSERQGHFYRLENERRLPGIRWERRHRWGISGGGAESTLPGQRRSFDVYFTFNYP
jgi:hypothetical protein